MAKATASGGFFQQVWVKFVGGAAAIVAGWFTGFLPKLWGWISVAAGWSYGWAVLPVTLPLWVLLIGALFAAVVPIALILMAYQRLSGPPQPRPADYVRDVIDGVVWRWEWLWASGRGEPYPFCAVCDTQLVETPLGYRDREESISLQCRKCDRTVGRLTKLDIRLEIDRRLRSGEWEQIVQRQRKEDEQRRMT